MRIVYRIEITPPSREDGDEGQLTSRVLQMADIMTGVCCHYIDSGAYTPYDAAFAKKHGNGKEFWRLHNTIWQRGSPNCSGEDMQSWFEQWCGVAEYALVEAKNLRASCSPEMQPFVEALFAQARMCAQVLTDVRMEVHRILPDMVLRSVTLVDVLLAAGGLSDP